MGTNINLVESCGGDFIIFKVRHNFELSVPLTANSLPSAPARISGLKTIGGLMYFGLFAVQLISYFALEFVEIKLHAEKFGRFIK